MTRIVLIGIDLFNFLLGMTTKNRTVGQVVGIMTDAGVIVVARIKP